MNKQEILDQSPDIPSYGGGKWAFYSANCCWWTSFPDDLGSLPPMTYDHETKRIKPNPGGPRLPCCPHCRSVLMQAPLEKFVEFAEQHPDHYGRLGIQIFWASHHRNSPRCYTNWADYEILVKPFKE